MKKFNPPQKGPFFGGGGGTNEIVEFRQVNGEQKARNFVLRVNKSSDFMVLLSVTVCRIQSGTLLLS